MRPLLRVPHVFVLLAVVTLVCAAATWVVPSGQFARETREVGGVTRNLVVPGTFAPLPKHHSWDAALLGTEVAGEATPVGVLGYLSSFPRGMEAAADIIFFIFIIGGVFGILERTGVIAATVGGLLRRLHHRGALLTVVLMTLMALGGSTLGMGEEFIPLIPVFVLVARRLGYDALYGMAMTVVAAQIGFAAATTNPFTVTVAQGIAELPLNSGLMLRVIFFVIALALGCVHLLRYGRQIRHDRSRSLIATVDEAWADDPVADEHATTPPFRPAHAVIIATGAAIFGFVVYAVQSLHWWMAEMGGGFLLIGLVAAVAARLPLDDAVQAFVKGMSDMVVAALVVGVARAIAVVLEDGQIMDTVIHAAGEVLLIVPRDVAAIGMLVVQNVLNLFIPSGSGQAAVAMPLMAPLADLVGISRQVAVFAFTCGDGFSNLIIPTSGILMAMLGLARVPYGRWLRFMLPLFGQLFLLSAVFLIIAIRIGYQ